MDFWHYAVSTIHMFAACTEYMRNAVSQAYPVHEAFAGLPGLPRDPGACLTGERGGDAQGYDSGAERKSGCGKHLWGWRVLKLVA
jgi:hypothetical protein